MVTAEKKDSQGLCFIGKISLPDFLQQKLQTKKGNIIEISDDFYMKESDSKTFVSESQKRKYSTSDGRIIGVHQGAHFFTVGQRKGLGVGGTPEPLFVIDTDVDENIVYVGQGKEHPGLVRKALKVKVEDIHWVRTDLKIHKGKELKVMARIRYRQPLQDAKLILKKEGLYVVFNKNQKAITSGQFVVWYLENELVGSGVIS